MILIKQNKFFNLTFFCPVKWFTLLPKLFGTAVISTSDLPTHIFHRHQIAPHRYLSGAPGIADDRQDGTPRPITGNHRGRFPGCGEHYDRGNVTPQCHSHTFDPENAVRIHVRLTDLYFYTAGHLQIRRKSE